MDQIFVRKIAGSQLIDACSGSMSSRENADARFVQSPSFSGSEQEFVETQ
jgi:hypothetical protein